MRTSIAHISHICRVLFFSNLSRTNNACEQIFARFIHLKKLVSPFLCADRMMCSECECAQCTRVDGDCCRQNWRLLLMAYKKWRESYRLNVKNGIRINRVSGISATLLSGAQERAHTTRSTHTNENGRIGGKEEEAKKKPRRNRLRHTIIFKKRRRRPRWRNDEK